MAIFHLNAQIISRGKGHSTVAAAAYRAGERLVDERTGEVHDYRRGRSRVGETEIIAPAAAPAWTRDRSMLWNKVEQSELRCDAQAAREFRVAIPIELPVEAGRRLVRQYVQREFVDRGMVADIAWHGDDTENPHAHILVTMRLINGDGFAKKERGWNKKTNLHAWREAWADTTNECLHAHGIDARIDHRTLGEQRREALAAGDIVQAIRLDRSPQMKRGPVLTHRPGAAHLDSSLRYADVEAGRLEQIRHAEDLLGQLDLPPGPRIRPVLDPAPPSVPALRMPEPVPSPSLVRGPAPVLDPAPPSVPALRMPEPVPSPSLVRGPAPVLDPAPPSVPALRMPAPVPFPATALAVIAAHDQERRDRHAREQAAAAAADAAAERDRHAREQAAAAAEKERASARAAEQISTYAAAVDQAAAALRTEYPDSARQDWIQCSHDLVEAHDRDDDRYYDREIVSGEPVHIGEIRRSLEIKVVSRARDTTADDRLPRTLGETLQAVVDRVRELVDAMIDHALGRGPAPATPVITGSAAETPSPPAPSPPTPTADHAEPAHVTRGLGRPVGGGGPTDRGDRTPARPDRPARS